MSPNSNFLTLTRRLTQIIAVIGFAGTALAGLLGGLPYATGFLIGVAASYLNFRNLQAIVASLGTPQSQGKSGAIAWILFRLILLFAGAFVIIKFTGVSLQATCVGLFVPVAAIVLELTFERTLWKKSG